MVADLIGSGGRPATKLAREAITPLSFDNSPESTEGAAACPPVLQHVCGAGDDRAGLLQRIWKARSVCLVDKEGGTGESAGACDTVVVKQGRATSAKMQAPIRT
jgi:hypothetical protein